MINATRVRSSINFSTVLEKHSVLFEKIKENRRRDPFVAVRETYDFAQFPQAVPIDGISFDYVLFQHGVGPFPERGAPIGFDPVSDGNDYIQIEQPRWTMVVPSVQNLHGSRFFKFTLFEHIQNMPPDNRTILAKQFGNLVQCQPDRSVR